MFPSTFEIRGTGNWSAHTIEEVIRKGYLEERRESIEYYTKILLAVLRKSS